MRLEKTLVSARGFVFFILTNRYIFHVVLFFIAVGTILSQLQTKQVAALDAGQNSLLYSLVTQGQEESVEEDLQNAPTTESVFYLGFDTLQAQERGIDYGYEEESLADLTIPGSIAIQPHSEFESEQPLPSVDTNIPQTNSPTTPTPQRSPGKTQTYIVRSGDTVATIAKRFGVDNNTILWANNLTSQARINPGDSLRIPPESGVLHIVKKNETTQQIANLYGVPVAEIRFSNQLNSNSTLSIGQELIIPGGRPRSLATITPPSRPSTTVNTAPTIRPGVPLTPIKNKTVDVYQEIILNKPDEREKPADAPIKSGTKLQWPTDLRVINQYYGWKHTGLDIDGDYTNALYASEVGVVREAGWNNGGYGLQIVIDHENGFKTRYAHASKLHVKVGDRVSRGQVIGMVGTTGRSTGTHLHYEVYVNGKRVNPLAYTK